MIRFPAHGRRGIGVGLDLPWNGATGFGHDPIRGDALVERVRSFLQAHAQSWSHAFFSWQPRDRAPPRLEDYLGAWSDLRAALPMELPVALHHTALNLGALGSYRRGELCDFTNALCERCRLQWVNEDLGLWSLAGRPLPYPLPPLLTDDGLRAAVANVRECQRALSVPLLVEFPGFARGVSLVVGGWNAYDFFRLLAVETDAPVTLDIGHLLSWQWWRGRRGEALYDELDRLPLEHCFEIHLSGCEIADGRFVDAHHGKILAEQWTLFERILPLCPNLRAITFEDPRLEVAGTMEPASAPSWQRIEEVTAWWSGAKRIARAATG
jgi:uncharacterized protein (UPF0276 family)